MSAETIEAWHWLRSDSCLNYPPHTKVEVGQTLKLDGAEPVLCEQGLHASLRALDALNYAPGEIVCRVRLGGVIVHGGDKCVASERTVLWMADATNVLHEITCQYAEEALRIAKVDDLRCAAAIDAKRKWLRGEITDAELDAARDAARAATSAATWAAARAATSAAARAATSAAAWAAARAATRAAARAAAWAAAWAAARAATRGAAWDAAWDAQNAILERELMEFAPKEIA